MARMIWFDINRSGLIRTTVESVKKKLASSTATWCEPIKELILQEPNNWQVEHKVWVLHTGYMRSWITGIQGRSGRSQVLTYPLQKKCRCLWKDTGGHNALQQHGSRSTHLRGVLELCIRLPVVCWYYNIQIVLLEQSPLKCNSKSNSTTSSWILSVILKMIRVFLCFRALMFVIHSMYLGHGKSQHINGPAPSNSEQAPFLLDPPTHPGPFEPKPSSITTHSVHRCLA